MPTKYINGDSYYKRKYMELLKAIEDIKAEIRQGVSDFANENGDIAYGFLCAENIIDKHIAESEEICR